MGVASEIRYQARAEGIMVRGYVVDLSRRSGWTQPGVDIIMPLVVTTLWGKHAYQRQAVTFQARSEQRHGNDPMLRTD